MSRRTTECQVISSEAGRLRSDLLLLMVDSVNELLSKIPPPSPQE